MSKPLGLDRPVREHAAGSGVAGFVWSSLVPCVFLGVLVGSPVLLHPAHAAVGWNPSSDFQIMTWSLGWWPWALSHGADPFVTPLLWSPHGFPVLWMTSLPAIALLALPLTLSVGPLAAYNALMFAAVGLAGGGAYLLCRELTRQTRPSIVGGILFALSPYMVGHTLSQHLNLTFVWPIPLVCWAIVRRRLGAWRSERSFVMSTAALLLIELGTSLELFLDLTVLMAVAFVIALLVRVAGARDVLRVARGVALAYCLCLPFLCGVMYLALAYPQGGLRYWAGDYSIDLANVVIPTPLTLLGAGSALHSVSRHFAGNIGEQDGYLGLPLLIVCALATRARFRDGAGFAAAVLVAVLALSLGPWITVAGHPIARQPISGGRLPIIADALPARLSLFTMLIAACLAAVWLSLPHRRAVRIAVGAVILFSLLPNLGLDDHVSAAWSGSSVTRFSTPAPALGPFGSPTWRRLIHPGETVLVLPTGDRTDALYWQLRASMHFRLALPATPFVPPKLDVDPTVVGLANNSLPLVESPAVAAARLRSYLLENHVAAVVVAPNGARHWNRIAAVASGTRPSRLAGSLVYRLPAALPLLRADGRHVERAGLEAWLRFDGRRARVEAISGPGDPTTLSSLAANALAIAAAANARGRNVVVFTAVSRGRFEVQVTTRDPGGRWQRVTLDRRSRPVWSPRIAVAPNGSILVTWFAAATPTPLLRAAICPTGGRWVPVTTLDAAEGLAGVAFAHAGVNDWRIAWHDNLAADQRVLAATFHNGWHHAHVVGSTFNVIDGVSIDSSGTRVFWRTPRGPHAWRARP